MNDWMRRLRGLNSAAITRVETTMASWDCTAWPVRAPKMVWLAITPPDVRCHQRRGQQAVDEGAVYEEVYVVAAVPEDRQNAGPRDFRRSRTAPVRERV